jgi:hypothetical protein
LQYPAHVAVDVAVPKSKHAKALTQETFVTAIIAGPMIIEIMLATIDLDHEPVLQARRAHMRHPPPSGEG